MSKTSIPPARFFSTRGDRTDRARYLPRGSVIRSHSSHLFVPGPNGLTFASSGCPHTPGGALSAGQAKLAIDELLGEKNYPCVPALSSLRGHEYMVGIYSEFGEGSHSETLLQDLLYFKDRQKETNSIYMSFWAIFTSQSELDEKVFEHRLWEELSLLSAAQGKDPKWDPNFSQDPSDPKFCLSLDGDAYFVVGLHPNASRKARKFRYPAMVFNLYEQFEELSRRGQYEAIVKSNRKREMSYDGSLNPMVTEHGDKWESIQFSGRENSADWKCPFHQGKSH